MAGITKLAKQTTSPLNILTEPDLRAGRTELYRVLRAVPAMVAIMHGPDHIFEFANPLYLKVVGKTEAIIGTPVRQVFPELKGQGILEILDKVYRTGKEFTADELEIELDTNNDGTPEKVHFNFVYQPMRDADGKVSGIMAHAVEVSAQVNARRIAEENEARYRMLFNSIDEGFCVIEMLYDKGDEAVDYRFVETNKVFEAQTGLKNAAGKTVKQLLPDIESHWIERYDKVALSGKPIRFTEGSEAMGRWFDVHASRVGEADKHQVAVLFKDITRQKMAEVRQETATRQITDVLESMGDAFFMLDKDWKIVRVNKVHEKVTMTKRGDIIGTYFWDTYPITRDLKYWTEYRKVMQTRRPAHFVEYYAPLDLWTEADVFPTNEGGISVFFRDITIRKQAEEALRTSESDFRFMAESLPQKIFTATPEGKVTYFNPHWSEYLGVPTEELIKSGVRQYIHPDDLEGNMRSWKWSVKTGKASQMEQRLLRADGQYRRHVSHVRAMYDESGNIVRWFGSMTDIEDVLRTAERNVELEKITAALTEQRTQLIELGKAKDEFISLASHQLRTPATGVKQYLGMVLEEYAGPVAEAQRRMLDQAYASNEREIAIINDLLKVAQVDAGKVQLKPRPADIGMLLEEIIDGQQSKFDERGQKVELHLPGAEITAHLDPERIRMVLENIVDNASKYTPPGKNIYVGLVKSRNSVIISVRDQGVGIHKKDIDKLFRKFTRLDNPLSVAVGGTGLGLYWAKKIVDLHGGTISVDSVVDEGSTFTVTIPTVQ